MEEVFSRLITVVKQSSHVKLSGLLVRTNDKHVYIDSLTLSYVCSDFSSVQSCTDIVSARLCLYFFSTEVADVRMLRLTIKTNDQHVYDDSVTML